MDDERQEQQEVPVAPYACQPKAMGWSQLKRALMLGAGIVSVSWGTVFLLAVAATPRLCGATRSCQLKWEQRQQEVDHAMREQPAPELPAYETAQDEAPTRPVGG